MIEKYLKLFHEGDGAARYHLENYQRWLDAQPKAKLKPETADQSALIEKLRSQLVWEFDLEHPPVYQQGGIPNEMHSLVTAEDCAFKVKRIFELLEQRDDLLAALESIMTCQTPIADRAQSMAQKAYEAIHRAKGGA